MKHTIGIDVSKEKLDAHKLAAGVTEKLWEISEFVAMIEEHEAEAAPKKHGPYKKKISN